MFEKMRQFAGEGSTHVAAGFFAAVANENAIFMAVLVGLLVIISTNWIYHTIQKVRGCKSPYLCVAKVMEDEVKTHAERI